MKRSLLTLGLAAVLSAWVGAEDNSALRPNAVEQAELLHRNRDLMTALVDGGIDLTRDESQNPLPRADNCQRMAVRLKDEILSAANRGESARAAELAQHLRLLMDSGLLPNLRKARQEIQPGSQEEPTLFQLRDRAATVLTQVQGALAASAEDQKLLDACRESIEKAVPLR